MPRIQTTVEYYYKGQQQSRTYLTCPICSKRVTNSYRFCRHCGFFVGNHKENALLEKAVKRAVKAGEQPPVLSDPRTDHTPATRVIKGAEKFCGKCNAHISYNHKYCAHCGVRLRGHQEIK